MFKGNVHAFLAQMAPNKGHLAGGPAGTPQRKLQAAPPDPGRDVPSPRAAEPRRKAFRARRNAGRLCGNGRHTKKTDVFSPKRKVVCYIVTKELGSTRSWRGNEDGKTSRLQVGQVAWEKNTPTNSLGGTVNRMMST